MSKLTSESAQSAIDNAKSTFTFSRDCIMIGKASFIVNLYLSNFTRKYVQKLFYFTKYRIAKPKVCGEFFDRIAKARVKNEEFINFGSSRKNDPTEIQIRQVASILNLKCRKICLMILLIALGFLMLSGFRINLNEGAFKVKEIFQSLEVTKADYHCPNAKLYDPETDENIQDSGLNPAHQKINYNYKNNVKYNPLRDVKKSHVEKHVTVIIKTGGRYDNLSTLLHSKNIYYPHMHIIIVDDEWNDQFEKMTKIYEEVTYMAMNETVGISKGRNHALNMVKTKYFLLLDDDNYFTEETNIEKLVAILESTDAHFVGGDHTVSEKYCGYFGKFTCLRDRENGTITLLHENGIYFEKIRGFEFCYRADIIKNFFVARKVDVLKFGGWNDELFLMEHEDFFIRMLQHGAKAIFCTDIKIGHDQTLDAVRTKRRMIENKYLKKWMEINHIDCYDYRPTN